MDSMDHDWLDRSRSRSPSRRSSRNAERDTSRIRATAGRTLFIQDCVIATDVEVHELNNWRKRIASVYVAAWYNQRLGNSDAAAKFEAQIKELEQASDERPSVERYNHTHDLKLSDIGMGDGDIAIDEMRKKCRTLEELPNLDWKAILENVLSLRLQNWRPLIRIDDG